MRTHHKPEFELLGFENQTHKHIGLTKYNKEYMNTSFDFGGKKIK